MKVEELINLPVLIFDDEICIWDSSFDEQVALEEYQDREIEAVEIYLKKC